MILSIKSFLRNVSEWVLSWATGIFDWGGGKNNKLWPTRHTSGKKEPFSSVMTIFG